MDPITITKKLVGWRRVSKIKLKRTKEINKYKYCVVATVFTQIKGKDFCKTFALVAMMTTTRCLLTTATENSWKLHLMDVSDVFLHGDLE